MPHQESIRAACFETPYGSDIESGISNPALSFMGNDVMMVTAEVTGKRNAMFARTAVETCGRIV
jgi:hypothetical protein